MPQTNDIDDVICPYSHRIEMAKYDDLWIASETEHEALCRVAGLPSKCSNEELEKSSVEIETTRFWAIFEECAVLARTAAAGEEEQRATFEKLQERFILCRGLTESLLKGKVACILQVEGFPYNLQQVVSAFSANAHPDWEKWDLIEKSGGCDGVDITSMSADDLWELVSMCPVASILSAELVGQMVERYSEWKARKLERQPFQAEAAVLASLRRMEEFWSNYCLCYFRCTAMANYNEALALHGDCVLQVHTVTLNL